MKEGPLSGITDDLARFLREAETPEIVITRHGKPSGVLIGFESEDDWFEYRFENDPRFLRRGVIPYSPSLLRRTTTVETFPPMRRLSLGEKENER